MKRSDLRTALNISKEEADTIFFASKKLEKEIGMLEVSPAKVARETVEQITHKSFDRILATTKKAANI
ncbi:MAG: hypothetical protein IJ907_01835 [Prevotella sp.]|nr:hypothetical protein [Prevotella sp.]MBR2096617.1 hypothetical protein [Prevotella sp.]